MKPIKFKEQNCTFAESQPEYQPLPALKDEISEGCPVISCWKMSFKERLIVLFTGKLWVNFLTFKKPLQPSYFTVYKWEIINKKYFKNSNKSK